MDEADYIQSDNTHPTSCSHCETALQQENMNEKEKEEDNNDDEREKQEEEEEEEKRDESKETSSEEGENVSENKSVNLESQESQSMEHSGGSVVSHDISVSGDMSVSGNTSASVDFDSDLGSGETSGLTPSDERSSEEVESSVKESDGFNSSDICSSARDESDAWYDHLHSGQNTDSGSVISEDCIHEITKNVSAILINKYFVPLNLNISDERQPFWLQNSNFNENVKMQFSISSDSIEEQVQNETKQFETLKQPTEVVNQFKMMLEVIDNRDQTNKQNSSNSNTNVHGKTNGFDSMFNSMFHDPFLLNDEMNHANLLNSENVDYEQISDTSLSLIDEYMQEME